MCAIAVFGDVQLFDAARPAARVGGFDGAQAALFDPLLEMADGLLKLLRPDLNPRLKHPVMLVTFAPALDVARLKQPHFLQQFQRPTLPFRFKAASAVRSTRSWKLL
jgi:hypothetical protein